MRRSIVLSLVAIFTGISSAHALPEDAKIALHVQAHTTKAPCSAAPTIPCFQYVTKVDVGVSYDVYLVVADVTGREGITGLSCGVAYDPAPSQGVDVYSWSFCGDGIEYPHDGANGPWPASGSGTRLTWVNCAGTDIPPNGYHTIAGSFYVYAYGPDQFQVTENMLPQGGSELAIAACGGQEANLPLSAAAKVTFSPGAVDTGYNPCTADLNNLPCAIPHNTSLFSFGSVGVGGYKDMAVRFSPGSFGIPGPWAGTVTLDPNTSPAFTIVDGESYSLPSLDDTATVVVRFTPTSTGQVGCVLRLGSVCQSVSLLGTGVLSPFTVVMPPAVSQNLLTGLSADQSLQVTNQGSAVLNWSTFAEQGTLEDILAALDAHSSEILNLIPNRVSFSGGVTGYWIGPGGFFHDFDNNFLSTDLSLPNEFLAYSDGVIRESRMLGTQGRYFTRKYPGLFVFAADMTDISQFKVTGNQNYFFQTNSSGQVSGLHHSYTATILRVSDGTHDSIHRFLLTADLPNSSLQYDGQHHDDNLTYNIGGATRLIYLLYMTPPAADVNVPSATDLSNACLNVVAPDPQWLTATSNGQLLPGEAASGSVHFSAVDLVPGPYIGYVAVRGNSVNRHAVIVPVTLNVMNSVEVSHIDVDPNTLNPGAHGHWVTAYVELPSGDLPEEIVLETVRAQNIVPADPDGFTIGDADQNGIPDVKLRFDREAFLRSLPPQDEVEALIQGEIRGKHYFSGRDAVRVLRPHIQSPNGSERLSAGTFRDVSWESDDLDGVDSIVLSYSPDGGQSWQAEGSTSGTTHVAWRVPANATANGLLKVAAYGSGEFIGYDVTDAPFSVVIGTTGIEPIAGARTTLLPNSPNPFRGSTQIGYTLAARAQVSLEIFNVSGMKVRTLVHDAFDAGPQQATWNGRDEAGRRVTPGIYVVRLRTPEFAASRRLLLMP